MHINLTKLTSYGIILITMFFYSQTFAQKALPSGTELVAAISGDTTATGARNNTSYTLARGGVYFTLGTIMNDFDLTLTATGDESLGKPRIVILVDATGSSSKPFQPYGNLTLKGIYLSSVTSAGTPTGYIIQAGVSGIRISLKECTVDSVQTAGVRAAQEDLDVYLEDCTFSNIANGNHTGRAIDIRDSSVDTVSIVNCTFYNVMHNIVGHFSGGEKYFKFDHNTVYNVMRCPLRIDMCPDIVVTNNLFIRTGFVGYTKYWETEYQGATENAMGSRDEFARVEIWKLDSTYTSKGITQKCNFKNNNFWIDKTVEAQFPDTVFAYRTLDFGFEKEIVGADTLTWLDENPTFVKAPESDYFAMAQECWRDGSPQTNPGFSNAGLPFNFAYSTSAASYTAASNGFPLGDLNWFPAKKAEWLIATDVKQTENSSVPTKYSLEQNYPNPFNPSTSIRFSVPEQGIYSLKVFNVLGQEVANLLNGKLEAGVHQTTFNASKLGSGIYFYSLTGTNVNITKKMMLVK